MGWLLKYVKGLYILPKSLSHMLNLWFYLWRDRTGEREGGQRLTLGVFLSHILLYCYRQGLSPSLKLVLWLQAWSLLLATRVHQKAPRIFLSLPFPVWGLKAQVAVLGFHMGLGIWTQVVMFVQQALHSLGHLLSPLCVCVCWCILWTKLH